MKGKEGLSTTVHVVIAVIVTAVVILAIVGGSVYWYKRCQGKEEVENTDNKQMEAKSVGTKGSAENHYESLHI